MMYPKKGKNRYGKYSSLKRKLHDIISIYVRIRDADRYGICTCCTCGKRLFWKSGKYGMHAGHYMTDGAHAATRYDLENIHAQCHRCNCDKEGDKVKMAEYIDRKYYPGKAEELRIKAGMHQKYDRLWFEFTIKEMSEKLAILRKEKNL